MKKIEIKLFLVIVTLHQINDFYQQLINDNCHIFMETIKTFYKCP